ncbi:hypothetical protein [Arthrobacter sp. BE255]|uniref:hypothetical protein n=1 Tax=Arthrobacter sp. BE255 TaxID=2817721 RepID=UPI002860AE6F|nr:hypothetical protein [Arthrobacter sp. BE255]MDR7159678.1 hypothetical protein [Arthrobacter sp. BE255]
MAVQPLRAGRRRRFEPIDQETLRHELALNRQQVAQADSSVRGALRQRNDSVAQALADGVPVARIADAAGVSKLEVRRRIGAGYTDLQPAGWPADTHLDAIRGRTQALAAAVEHKSVLEVRRRSLTVMALKTDQLDLFEVASLAAVPPERIRSEMRGITLRSVRLAN